jgi:plasmid stabilization system protein ParE
LPRLLILPAARDDLDAAFAWYHAQDPADPRLLSRFQDALDAAYQRILDKPNLYPFVLEPVRRVLLRKFPYAIYYVHEAQHVFVLAVLHHKRDPRIWKQRALTRR